MKLIEAILQGDLATIKKFWDESPNMFYESFTIKISEFIKYTHITALDTTKKLFIKFQHNIDNSYQSEPVDSIISIEIAPYQLLIIMTPGISTILEKYEPFIVERLIHIDIHPRIRQDGRRCYCNKFIFSNFLCHLEEEFGYTLPKYHFGFTIDKSSSSGLMLPFDEKPFFNFIVLQKIPTIKWLAFSLASTLSRPQNQFLFDLFYEYFNQITSQKKLDDAKPLRKLFNKLSLDGSRKIDGLESFCIKMNTLFKTLSQKIIENEFLEIDNKIGDFLYAMGLIAVPESLEFFDSKRIESIKAPKQYINTTVTSDAKIQLLQNFTNLDDPENYRNFVTLVDKPRAIKLLENVNELIITFVKTHPKHPKALRTGSLTQISVNIINVLEQVANVPLLQRIQMSQNQMLIDTMQELIAVIPNAETVITKQLSDKLSQTFFGKTKPSVEQTAAEDASLAPENQP